MSENKNYLLQVENGNDCVATLQVCPTYDVGGDGKKHQIEPEAVFLVEDGETGQSIAMVLTTKQIDSLCTQLRQVQAWLSKGRKELLK
mgnify:CR=1 FL=1